MSKEEKKEAGKKEKKKLPDEHQKAAREMVLRHRKKKKCNKCYDRGYLGVTEDNMILPCSHCVDQKSVFDEWKVYVKARPDLLEAFGDQLEDEEEGKEEDKKNEAADNKSGTERAPWKKA